MTSQSLNYVFSVDSGGPPQGRNPQRVGSSALPTCWGLSYDELQGTNLMLAQACPGTLSALHTGMCNLSLIPQDWVVQSAFWKGVQ